MPRFDSAFRTWIVDLVIPLLVGLSACVLASCGSDSKSPTTPTPGATPSFNLSCSASTIAVGWAGVDATTCAVAAANNFDADVNLSCTGLPSGSTCAVNPSVVHPKTGSAATATLSVTYMDGMPAGRWPVSIMGMQGATTKTATVTVQKDADTVSAKCPLPSDVAAIDRDIALTFENDPSPAQACTPEQSGRALSVLQARVYVALGILRRLSFSQPLPWTGESIYGWMIHTIRAIRFRNDIDNSFCCIPLDAVNIQTKNLALALARLPQNFSLIENFLGLIVHETRHNNGKPHTCGNSDQTLAELGAWGCQYWFHLWVAQYTDPSFVPAAIREGIAAQAHSICEHNICAHDCS